MTSNLKKQIALIIGVFVTAACVVFFATNKGDLVLYLQTLHSATLDFLFANITKLGEEVGLIPALCVLMLRLPLPIKEKGAVLFKIVLCLIGMFLVVVLFKQYVFDFNRPLAYFEERGISILQVEGVKLNSYHSFPSGHTATAVFGWYLMFQLMLPNTKWRNLWVIVALLVGLSRIYLGQHFLQDVWFGALIGFAWAFFAHQWILRKHKGLIYK
jgi:membrane-associated phospholipid phosphatase